MSWSLLRAYNLERPLLGHFLMENAKRFRVETATSDEMTSVKKWFARQGISKFDTIILQATVAV
jgi:hypothetical protein